MQIGLLLAVFIWLLPFIPVSCCFNIIYGLIGGFYGQIAPLPTLGNSFVVFLLYWVVYFTACTAITFIVIRKKP